MDNDEALDIKENAVPQNRSVKRLPPGMAAKMWKPGQSGNPGGRPKKKPLTEQLERILDDCGRDPRQRTYAQRLVESMVKRAIKKSDFAAKEIWERAEGKVPQAVTGANGGPMQFQVAVLYGSADQADEDE